MLGYLYGVAVQRDCIIRGYLAKIVLRDYLEEQGFDVKETADSQLIVQDNISIDIKTSLRTAGDHTLDDVRQRRDIKISVPYRLKDIHVQFYYDLDKVRRERIAGQNFEDYQNCLYFMGWKDRTFIESETEFRRQQGFRTVWTYGYGHFLYCPLETALELEDLISFLRRR